MPPVTLHQPVEGLDRGDTYTGPREDFYVQEGYASRAKDSDGTHATSGSAKNDARLAVNREAPNDGPPQPKTEVKLVDNDPAAAKRPDAPGMLDSTQPRQKEIDKKLAEVAEGKRDPNAPDVVLEDARKARVESQHYDGSTDEKVLKAQRAEEAASLQRLAKADEQRTKDAVKAKADELKAQGAGGEHEAPAERVLIEETGVGTVAETKTIGKDGKYVASDESKPVGDTPVNPLLDQLPQLAGKDSVSKVADVTKAPEVERTTTVDTGKPGKGDKAADEKPTAKVMPAKKG